MSQGGIQQENAVYPAKLTFSLGIFLLILLILIPIFMNTEILSGIILYVIYSLFLTIVGILLGSTMMWMQLQNGQKFQKGEEKKPVSSKSENTISAKNWNEDERWIISYLIQNDGKCHQASINKESGMSKAKVSRQLGKLESKNAIERYRDGMGNRIILNQEVEL